MQAGNYKAIMLNCAVEEKGSNTRLAAQYQTTHILDGGAWQAVSPQNIMGWHYLTKDEGKNLNEHTINALRTALNWDGMNLEALDALENIPVQITVRDNDYNGKVTSKVDWIDHIDYAPGVKRSTPEAVKKIQANLGSRLRAISGGVTLAAKPKPKPKPKPQPAAPAPAPAPAPAAPVEANATTEQDVWSLFYSLHGAGCESKWFAFCAEQFGEGVPNDQVTPAQWATAFDALQQGAALPY